MDTEPEDEPLELVFVPALVVLLRRAEMLKQQPLTEAEVFDIRDGATVVAVRPSVGAEMETERGYADIDPEDCWQVWQDIREQFTAS